MSFSAGFLDFVHAAVRLPHSRLGALEGEWRAAPDECALVARIGSENPAADSATQQVRSHILRSAVNARQSGESKGPMTAEDIEAAILPGAQAVFWRDTLEHSTYPAYAAVYVALTKPFRDIVRS